MRFSRSAVVCVLAATLTHALPTPQDDGDLPSTASCDPTKASQQLDQLAQHAIDQINDDLEDDGENQKRGGCTLKTLTVRKEWGSLSANERKDYTNAVLCLQAKQANTPSSLIPGAKSRFDDFVGLHINDTNFIHYTGTFLAWHRYFTWQYEQALRNECGYKGAQPYWDWAKTARTGLEVSPILDGSDTSMSGNGAPVPNQGNVVLGGNGLPEILLPPGTGGGCVTSGPFKDMTVNLGPVALGLTDGTSIGNGNGLAYNPRCLKRDLTDAINRRFANATSVVDNILRPTDIYDFQMTMQGYPGSGEIGIHGGGHYAMGGDPGRDVFTSPSDPLFYLHHGMIDRVWWIWQLLDRETRTGAEGISGTGTFLNEPPSANTTLDTVIDLGYAGGAPLPMRDLMSTTDGPFCYIYL
ncbi:Di-copper centre-containing protein [Corynespora cassiicola Philippines]|uniref:Di-copper centre-containing protein n=1 Tax=Corynespora cassiicola Philippines TaxID=1448308 RepID=A0A2T2NXX0_CORCC|nr:Di-copper centre-containing protein [Corynespora cassiicola Philippines]